MTNTQEMQAAEIAELKATLEQRDAKKIEQREAEIKHLGAKLEQKSLMALIKQPISLVD
jgi:hypothetical protein